MNINIEKELYNAISLLNNLITTKKFSNHITVPVQKQEKALDIATKHLFFHNKSFGIQADSTDVYKLMSWYGFYLSKELNDKKGVIYLATLDVLNNKILFNEVSNNKISHSLITKMYKMLVLDGEDDRIAIGKNGLYISFRTARDICISS